jgi:hypothetical protein
MTMHRMMLLAGTATLAVALSQGAALAQTRHHYYHHHHHHHHHYGRVVRSRPVPDTPHNRDRFGGPMSHGGKSTAPVGN